MHKDDKMIQGTEYNRGASGVLFENKQCPNIITKRTKKKNITQEYTIHTRCYDICVNGEYHILRIPKVHMLHDTKSYSMEKIDDRVMMICPEGELLAELNDFIGKLDECGIRAFDYELYVQDNGTVYMIDFDKFNLI